MNKYSYFFLFFEKKFLFFSYFLGKNFLFSYFFDNSYYLTACHMYLAIYEHNDDVIHMYLFILAKRS